MQSLDPVFAGSALLQSGAPFSANPLSGNYVGYQSGMGSTTGASRVSLFLITASGTGISGTQLRNDGGSFQSQSLNGITYSVSSSGRMTIPSTVNNPKPPIFYLVSANELFILSADPTVDAGVFQSQSATSASGTYAFGTVDPQSANGGDNLGVANFSSNLNITQDKNSNGSQNAGQTQTLSYSVNSTGLGQVPQSGSSCTISASSTTCQAVFYVISPTKAVVMDAASQNPSTQLADQ